jgi:type I restriction enzyme S subunit
MPEQRKMVGALVDNTAVITGATASAHHEISLLREYRTRLIADVVTGKLDVREAAARLPDETEEPEPLDDADAPSESDEEREDSEIDAPAEEAEA